MADIFIAYDRTDTECASTLARCLALEGWSVFWDEEIGAERFRLVIEREIGVARAMVCLWSPSSSKNDNVLSEADRAKRSQVPLVALLLGIDRPPLFLDQDNGLPLSGWNGDREAREFRRLVQALDGIAPRGPASAKPFPRPCFFRSISSHECFLKAEDAMAAVKWAGAPPVPVLASAFDLIHDKGRDNLIADMAALHGDGSLVALDSGGYEADRTGTEWSRDEFHKALRLATYDIAFCFDIRKHRSPRPKTIAKGIAEGYRRDADVAPAEKLAPIVHPPETIGNPVPLLPDICAGLAEEVRPPLIAIPERELGDGIVQRALAVYRIRQALDCLGRHQPIHLLGTGNPLSIAIFAAAGADSFDGLEWCRTVADHDTARLYHWQQYDFFTRQIHAVDWDEERREAILNPNSGISYRDRIALHNLAFFERWMDRVEYHVAQGTAAWLEDFLPSGAYDHLRRALPEVFS